MKYLPPIIIYHIRSIVVGILLIGGMVAFGIVYVALSTPESPTAFVPSDGENVSAAGDRFERVFTWANSKEQHKNSVPKISTSAFFLPPAL